MTWPIVPHYGRDNGLRRDVLTGQTDEFGVLRMTLHAPSYDYRFVSTLGARSSFIDQGSGTCH